MIAAARSFRSEDHDSRSLSGASWLAAISRSRPSFQANSADPMPRPPYVRVDEAHLLVDARAVGLLVPPDAAVADGPPADLREDEVAGRIAPVEVVVRRREPVGRLDPVVALTAGGRVDDPCKVGIVGAPPEHPEVDAVELRNRCH